jgi:hypothetical protein
VNDHAAGCVMQAEAEEARAALAAEQRPA